MKTFKHFFSIVITFIILSGIFAAGVIMLNGYKDYKIEINNNSIESLVTNIQGKNNYVKIENISQDFLLAIVAIEDKRFLKHNGVDYISLVRAVCKNIEAGKVIQGGSTITQQLAKNMYFDGEQKLTRKIAELLIAKDLEKKYSKNEILELYVNVIYYGNNSYGIREATKGYFDKEPDELTYDEATLLAGVPQAPSYYDLTKNMSAAKNKQEYVEKALKEYKINNGM